MKLPFTVALDGRPATRHFLLLAALSLVTACGPSSDFKTALAKAKTGDPQAQLAVGLMFLHGNDVKPNSAEGLNWIKQAAQQGFPAAQRTYGMILRAAPTGSANAAQAREWIEKAAHQNDAAAQAELAGMLGVFSPLFEPIEAMKWAILAEKNGATNAPTLLKLIEAQMTASQIAQARGKAAEFGKDK